MKKLFLLTLLSLIFIRGFSQSASRVPGSPFPVSQIPDTLYVINMESLTDDQRLTVITLQGMLAKTKPEIFCWRSVGFPLWLEDLHENYGIYIDSTILDRF